MKYIVLNTEKNNNPSSGRRLSKRLSSVFYVYVDDILTSRKFQTSEKLKTIKDKPKLKPCKVFGNLTRFNTRFT